VIVSPRDGLLVPLLFGRWGPRTDVVPVAIEARVRSYCLPYDPICSFDVTSLSQQLIADAHASYWLDPLRIVDRAAHFVGCRLQSTATSADCGGPDEPPPLGWGASRLRQSAQMT
jgi:hypothetical protein